MPDMSVLDRNCVGVIANLAAVIVQQTLRKQSEKLNVSKQYICWFSPVALHLDLQTNMETMIGHTRTIKLDGLVHLN